MAYLWKSMKENLASGYNGEKWKIGKWKKIKGEPSLCSNGYHASKNIIDAMQYTNLTNLAKVEVRGKAEKADDKQAWTEMRVVKAWEWKKQDSVALAIYCAELIIDNFETQLPDDKRPRKAIQAAKQWLKNPNKQNQSAARSAESAAKSAARSAASAAWSAESAARSAARSAILTKCHKWILLRIKKLEEIH